MVSIKTKIFLILCGILFVTLTAYATESGQYRDRNFGQDFNIIDVITDVNGLRDIDYSADCNLMIRQESTNTLLSDGNKMLNDPVVLGAKYYFVNASNTTLWTEGYYTAWNYCKDGNGYGTENLSFTLFKSLSDLIKDTNAIGKGLNGNQNSILYDINKWIVNPAIDYVAPVIIFSYPLMNGESSSTLIKFSITDKSDLNSIEVFVNGISSPNFNQNTACTNGSCSYYENALVINQSNDINVIAKDVYDNNSNTYLAFFYSSTRPRIGTTGSLLKEDLSDSFSIQPNLPILIYFNKGEKITQVFTLKNNTKYNLSIQFSPSKEIFGTIFLNDLNNSLAPFEEKDFQVTFMKDTLGDAQGQLIISSQFSSKTIDVGFKEKPFNWWVIIILVIVIAFVYFFLIKKN